MWRPQGWEFSRSRPLQIVNYFKGLHPPCKRQPKLPVGTAVQPLGSQPLLLGGWHLAWIKYPGHHRVQSQQVLSKLPVGLCPVLCMGAGVSLSASAEGAKTTGQLTGSWGWSLALNVRLSVTNPVSLHDPLFHFCTAGGGASRGPQAAGGEPALLESRCLQANDREQRNSSVVFLGQKTKVK